MLFDFTLNIKTHTISQILELTVFNSVLSWMFICNIFRFVFIYSHRVNIVHTTNSYKLLDLKFNLLPRKCYPLSLTLWIL